MFEYKVIGKVREHGPLHGNPIVRVITNNSRFGLLVGDEGPIFAIDLIEKFDLLAG